MERERAMGGGTYRRSKIDGARIKSDSLLIVTKLKGGER